MESKRTLSRARRFRLRFSTSAPAEAAWAASCSASTRASRISGTIATSLGFRARLSATLVRKRARRATSAAPAWASRPSRGGLTAAGTAQYRRTGRTTPTQSRTPTTPRNAEPRTGWTSQAESKIPFTSRVITRPETPIIPQEAYLIPLNSLRTRPPNSPGPRVDGPRASSVAGASVSGGAVLSATFKQVTLSGHEP